MSSTAEERAAIRAESFPVDLIAELEAATATIRAKYAAQDAQGDPDVARWRELGERRRLEDKKRAAAQVAETSWMTSGSRAFRAPGLEFRGITRDQRELFGFSAPSDIAVGDMPEDWGIGPGDPIAVAVEWSELSQRYTVAVDWPTGPGDGPAVGSTWTHDPASEPRMAHVERRTWPHRRDLARNHDAIRLAADREAVRLQGRRLRAVADGSATPEEVEALIDQESAARRRAKWHRDRAGGQRQRFGAHHACQRGVAVSHCKQCKSESVHLMGCGVVRLCVRCRDRRAQQRRAVLWRAREAVIRDETRQGRMRQRRRGGAWAEWHMVLTMPDQRIPNAGDRVRLFNAAWPVFSRYLSRYQRGEPIGPQQEGAPRAAQVGHGDRASKRKASRTARGFAGRGGMHFSRTFEWTPGSDGGGHPHFHVWMLGPRISPKLLRSWWQAALVSVGVPARDEDPLLEIDRACLEWVVYEVHKGAKTIQSARLRSRSVEGGHVIGYVEGWCVSEVTDKHGRTVTASAETMAQVYMALEGKRHAQTSRGLMKRGAKASRCGCCGAVGSLVMRCTGWRSSRLLEVADRYQAWPEHQQRAGPALAKARWRRGALVRPPQIYDVQTI